MRVLQLNHYADQLGGAEVYAHALTRELRARGHVVGFFGTSEERAVASEFEHVVHRRSFDPRLQTLDPAVRTGLADYVERLRPDVIHLHNVVTFGLDLLAYLGTTGLPVVQTVHDANLICPNSWCVWADGTVCEGGIGVKCFQHDCQRNYPFDGVQALRGLLAHRALVDIVDVTLSPSRFLAEKMARHGRRNVRHLTNFVEPIALPAGIERAAKELVYIGRLTPEKGVESLLDAMALVRNRDPEVHLKVVGGPAARPLSARAGLLGKSVELLGPLPRAELGRHYASAAACVMPSIWCENAPLIALECLAAGLPLLASRIGGIPEVVEDGVTGFTFRPRDARDMAETVVRFLALEPRERARMSDAMRARAVEYQLAPHVTRVEQTYAETLEAARARPAPAARLDEDLLAPLHALAHEKARLVEWFEELERRRLRFRTLEFARGIARRLKLPKVFR